MCSFKDMAELEKILKNKIIHSSDELIYKPIIFDLDKNKDRNILSSLFEKEKNIKVIDETDKQKREFSITKNPKLLIKKESTQPQLKKISFKEGLWVYYPWRNAIVHILKENQYNRIQTYRNFNLIFPEEQRNFKKIKIGIAGLNVGNSAAVCIALEGGCQYMKFADNDFLELSNLNRFRAGIVDLGLNKAIITARQVCEINPFAKIKIFHQGIIPNQEEKFLLNPKVDILIEEMDNLKLKLSIREKARKNRIPVLMVTSDGPNLIIDIERFDINSKLPFLNGNLKEKISKRIQEIELKKENFQEIIFLLRDFVGANNFISERISQSFSLVGKKLAAIPQLAEGTFMRGAVICYLVRQIASGKKLSSGRYYLKINSLFK